MDSLVARGCCFVVLVLVVCATAAPAQASFPGRNGTIVYSWTTANKDAGSPTSIRAVSPRGGRVRVLRECPLRTDLGTSVPYPDCEVSSPRYSPNGRRIAFPIVQMVYPVGQPWQSRPGLGLMASDGTGLEERAGANRYQRLAWSPDGDRFLLQRELAPPGYPSTVFLASLDGTELSQVTPESTQAPDWSSTGQIAFGRYTDLDCRPGCKDIFVMRLGGTPRRLTYRGGSSPSWSPHGTKLAFVRSVGQGRADIYLIRRNGRGLRRLTRRGGHSPAWSPNGKWVAFIREGDLYVVRTTGRGRRRLVDELGPDKEYGLGPQVESLDWQPLPRG